MKFPSPKSNKLGVRKVSEHNFHSANINLMRNFFNSRKKQINYIYYDPEIHWCQSCNVFPKTAKDYLNHMQSPGHTEKTMGNTTETPWRDNLPDVPTYPADAPTKRTPIRGLQFFVASAAWYCKLCSYWMGDLHCASVHLKSEVHSEKYNVRETF